MRQSNDFGRERRSFSKLSRRRWATASAGTPGRGHRHDQLRASVAGGHPDDRWLALVRAYGAACDGDLVSCQAWLQLWAAAEPDGHGEAIGG